jgi:hypothetical protein
MHPLQNETPDGALKVAGQFFEFMKDGCLGPETVPPYKLEAAWSDAAF